MKELIAVAAACLAFVGNVSYLRDVIREKVRPHPYTWFVWSVVSMTTFFGGLAKGAGIGALPTGVAEAFTIVIFGIALHRHFMGRNGVIRPIDHVFLAVCLAGLVPWALTSDPTISVVTVVAVDVVAFVPTLRKTIANPASERPMLFAMNVARHVLTLFVLAQYNVATTLHSVAMIVLNAAMSVIIVRGSRAGK